MDELKKRKKKKKKKIRAFFEVSPRVRDGQIETNAVKKNDKKIK